MKSNYILILILSTFAYNSKIKCMENTKTAALNFSDLTLNNNLDNSDSSSPTEEDKKSNDAKINAAWVEYAKKAEKDAEEAEKRYRAADEKNRKLLETNSALTAQQNALSTEQATLQANFNHLNQSYKNLVFFTVVSCACTAFLSGILAYKTLKKQNKYYAFKHNYKIDKKNENKSNLVK